MVDHPEAASAAQLRASVAAADLRLPVLCLFHLTGDTKWLEPPFQPLRATSASSRTPAPPGGV